MSQKRSSLKPLEGANRTLRRKLDLKGEIALATAPTVTILLVMGFVEALTQQRLLFASLASSAFLIYLDPQHGTNAIRTLILAQMMAAGIGFITYFLFGGGYLSGGIAMILAIFLMIILDAMVESREDIAPRPSQLNLGVRLSSHPASDVLSFGACSCVCNRGSFHEWLEGFYFSNFYVCNWRDSSLRCCFSSLIFVSAAFIICCKCCKTSF
ncbi:HPP family protein [Trichormus sp. NMC-1]|uniref:HPP family protein n=1 Tax=Trichormus sp. NMC-1 TaxID=1853259 RepID=UPI000AF0DD9A|nr:HPP family protein [Trichormus sp. NMC-1]